MTDRLLRKSFSHANRQDAAAGLCFALVTVYLIFYALRGIGVVDETSYLALAHRLTLGDVPFLHEWHLAQLTGVLLYVPFKLFRLLTGSTEGVVLFFRFLFIAVQGLTSLFIYIKLRKTGYAGLCAALMFYHHTVVGILALSYYSIAILGCTVVGLLYFADGELTKKKLFCSGIIIALSVMAQPLLCVLYFLWAAAVLLCEIRRKVGKTKKEPSDLLRLKNFLLISGGIACVAAVFIAFLLSRAGITDYIKALPHLFEDSTYQVSASGGERGIFSLERLGNVLKENGLFFDFGFVLLTAFVAADRKRSCRKGLYTVCAFALLAVNTAYVIFLSFKKGSVFTLYYRDVPFFLIFPSLYLLTEKKDQRLLCFWLFGLSFSVLVDISSAFSVMMGNSIASIPCWLTIGRLSEETAFSFGKKKNLNAAEKKVDRGRRLRRNAVLFGVAAVLLCELLSGVQENRRLFFEHYYASREERVDARLESGPMKGICTCASTADIYYDILSDLDRIKQAGAGTLYVDDLFSWMYLYADLPYACYSPGYEEADRIWRQELYYSLYPEKEPEYVYIPRVTAQGFTDCRKEADEKLKYYKEKYVCEVTDAKAGYIVRLKSE